MNLYHKEDGALRHELVMGKSGAGKTTYLMNRLWQQMKRGGGAFVLDAKADYEFRDDLWRMARAVGREGDMRCVNIDNAGESHTYNPLLRGDAIAVASRFTDTVDTGSNASADHFKSQGNLALTAALTPIKSMKTAYNAKDLYILLSNPEAMEWLVRQVPAGQSRQTFEIWLESFRAWDPALKAHRINTNMLRTQIGGMIARLYTYSTGEIGKVMNAYSPEVDLFHAIMNNQIVYFMIPSLDKSEVAIAFAKLFFSDFRSTLAALYRLPKYLRPRIPHENYFDEFGSYANRLVSMVFELARGANLPLIAMVQTYANLLNVSDEFADQLIGNTEIQTFFQIGDPNTAEFAARVTGEVLRKFRSESQARSKSAGNRNLQLDPFHSVSSSDSESISTSERYDYRIRPEEYMQLDLGEAYVYVKGAKAGFKVQMPLIEPPKNGAFTLRSYSTKERAGLNLSDLFDTDFSASSFANA